MKKNLLLFLFVVVSHFVQAQGTVISTIIYNGAQAQGCCSVCGFDYWCINNTLGCGSSVACDSRAFIDPVPAGNIVIGVKVTYYGAGCYAIAEPSYINGVLIGSAPNDANCACGIACSAYPVTNSFPCPTGLPSYNYGGSNTFTSCPDNSFCPQRVEIELTYSPVSIAPASVSASPNPSCGGSVTLTQVGGTLGSGASWDWFTGSCGGTFVSSGNSITVTPTSTTTYYVRASGGGCGTTTCTPVTVTVNTPSTDPVAATATLTNTCGESTTLSVSGGSLGTGASWQWYSGSCGGTLVGTNASLTVTPTSTTTYYVRAEGACNNTVCQQVTITVNQIPFAIATPSAETICSGSTTNIALTSFVSGTTFAWTVVQTGVSGATNGNGLTIAETLTTTGGATGTAVYTITPTANGCVGNPITVTITVNPIPVLSVSSVNPTICGGSVLPINITSTVTGTSFTWTVVQTNVIGGTNGNGSTIADSLVATGGGTGTAVYTINGSANGCNAAPITNTITLNPDPGSTAIATPSTSTICSGTSTSISLTSSVPGTIFTWTSTNVGVNGASSSTGSTIADVLTTSGNIAGTVTYLVSSTANGCTGSPISVIVNVNPTPVGTATPTSLVICSGDTTNIALTSPVAGTTFSWTVFQNGVSGGIFGTDSTIAQILTATGSTPGTAIYTIIPTTTSCAGAAILVTVTVNASDDASFVYSSATYCTAGTNPTPIITGVSGGTFSSIPSGLDINPVTGAINLANSGVGVYTVTYTTTGNCADSSSITMTIDNSSPFADFTYSGSPFCQNGANPLPVFGTNASAGVFSASPIGLSFVQINTGEIDLANSAPGTYLVTNSIPPSGPCSGIMDTTTVVIIASDDASFVYTSATYCTTGSPQTPIITGLPGGTFFSNPAGLSLNPSTGTITLSSCLYGTYLLSYKTNGVCPDTSSITMTIDTITPSATFSYVGSPFCSNSANPFPFFVPNASAGIFSANPSGLVFVHVNTGEIDLAGSTPGTYVVTNTIPASGVCSPISDTYTITIGPADDATFVYSSATYCTTGPNQTPVITGLSGGVFSAIPPGLSFNSVTGEINLAQSQGGSYTLTYSTNGSCPNSSSIVMTINDSSSMPNFSYAAGTFCQNDINQYPAFTFGSSAGYFTSTPVGLVIVHPNTGEIDLSTSTPGTYTVTNTIPASGFCDAIVATTTITINAADDASFVYSSATYCTTGQPQTPIITGLTGGVFSSVPAGLTLNPSTGQITLSTSLTGVYQLTYTTVGGCPNTSSITMTIDSITPSATFSYAGSPFCTNGINPLPTFGINASAGIFTANPIGLAFVHVNTGEIDLANSTPGTYIVTNTIPQSGVCLPISDTYTITIGGADDATFVYTSATYCTTGPNQLPAITGLQGGIFSSIPPGLNFNPVTGEINLSLSQVGDYNLTYSTNGSCPNTSSIVITIADSTPFSTFSYAAGSFCQNDINQYPAFVQGSSPGVFTSSPSGLSIVHPNTGEIDLAASIPGTYTITNTIPPSGVCTEVESITTIIINPSDDAAFTYPSATYCTTGTPQNPTITGLQGGTFSAVPPGLVLNPSTGQITLSSSLVGIYTLSYSTFGGCPNTSSIIMTINDTISSASFAYVGSPFCQTSGTNPFPVYNSGASAGIYSATPTGLVFEHVNTGEIDLAGSAPGTYLITNTIPASGVCAFVNATYSITINSAPVVTLTPNALSFCESLTALLNIGLSSNIPGTSFSWTVIQSGLTGATAGNGATISQTLTAQSTPATANYTITTDANGCSGSDTTITVVINPTVSDTSAAVVTLASCGTTTGGISGITVASGQTPFTYQWKDSANTVVGSGVNLSNVGLGNYSLTITDGNGCSRVIGPFLINSTPAVTAAFTMDVDSGETPLNVNFLNTSENATNYLWSFGTGDTSNETSPSYIYSPLGNFIVCLTASDDNGCFDSVCASVDVYLNSVFLIPNVFTPNDDNINDVFVVKGIGLKKLDAEIYNRWGQKEYEWHSPLGGWDGRTASGVKASDGTYYYIINAEGIDGEKYFEKGSFMLIRD